MSVEFLVANGHTMDSTLKYTPRQVEALVSLAWDRHSNAESFATLCRRMAYASSSEAFKEFYEEIGGQNG